MEKCGDQWESAVVLQKRMVLWARVVAWRSGWIPYFFFLFTIAPVSYGSSQVRGQIKAAAADLHHSHSDAGSEPYLLPKPQLVATLDP